MRAVLWKDYRLNRLLLIFGAAVLFGPYLAGAIIYLYSQLRYGVTSWSETYWVMSVGSLAFSLFTIAMLGANAIAAERADRSAEFLAYLPASRRVNITSKAVIVVGAFVVIWAVNLSALFIVGPLLGGMSFEELRQSHDNLPVMLRVFAATSVAILGVSWLFSSLSSSHALATGMGIAAPVVIGFPLGTVEQMIPGWDFAWWYVAACTTVGAAGFVTGIVCYLRRVEP